MEKFKSLTATVMPISLTDIDTDMIIPAQFLTSVSKEGYGKNLFRRLRDQDPQFPLNQTKYKDAAIMLTDRNFGCGSSREHAVWAILDAGFKVVISKSFADIFFSNSAKNGLVLVTLPEQIVDELLAEAEKHDLTVTIDLEAEEIYTTDGKVYKFKYDPFRRHCILNGLDDIDYILSMKNEISQFRKEQMTKPFVSTVSKN